MIVKDESAIIERCLVAAMPWIDAYAVHDTGSTDGTPELVASLMRAHGVPGEVTYGPFVNFAQARNDSLRAARAGAGRDTDYLLLCDADMELVVDDPDFRSGLDAPAYSLDQVGVGLRYGNIRLIRSGDDTEYRGVTHEALVIPGGWATRVPGAWYRDHADGASREVKFERDLALLREALEDEPDDPRYQFYLAQTLRDMGRTDEALEAYAARARLAGWDQEVWYALHQVAVLGRARGNTLDEVAAAFMAAYEARPSRAETLVELAGLLRESGRHALAHVFATRAVELPMTDDGLFVSPECYGWRARDELAVSSFWVGRYAESAALNAALLADPELPPEHLPRLERNLGFAREHLR